MSFFSSATQWSLLGFANYGISTRDNLNFEKTDLQTYIIELLMHWCPYATGALMRYCRGWANAADATAVLKQTKVDPSGPRWIQVDPRWAKWCQVLAQKLLTRLFSARPLRGHKPDVVRDCCTWPRYRPPSTLLLVFCVFRLEEVTTWLPRWQTILNIKTCSVN